MQTDNHPMTLSFAHDAIAFLRQGIDLLGELSNEQYVASMPPVYKSTVGAHVRHILDHFRCLTEGVPSGSVDYDRRERDELLETQRDSAIRELHMVVRRIDNLNAYESNLPLRVKMDCGGGDERNNWSQSSLARELQFLTSHTIHHYALVAAILDHAGCQPPAGFGVSPSTLHFDKQRQAQAR